MLTRRLNQLERSGLVEREVHERRTADEPYMLTPRGLALEPAIVALAKWGAAALEEPEGTETYTPAWTLLSLKARYDHKRTQDHPCQFEFRVDTETLHAILGGPSLVTGFGPASRADVVIHADTESFLLVFNGYLSLREAIRQHRVSVTGSFTALATGLQALDMMHYGRSYQTPASSEPLEGATP